MERETQSFRQWLEKELTTCHENVKDLPVGSLNRIKYEITIANYKKVLNEWIERSERG